MAIEGVKQPAVIQIDNTLRLRKFDGVIDVAFEWYQDKEMVYLVDGVKNVYTMDRLLKMYQYLDNIGELYFIEVLESSQYKPVGDVTFWQDDMPIVIGDSNYRGKGIGRKVVSALAHRGRELGFDHVSVGEIYDWNEASRRCFESVGFQAYEKTEKGNRYKMVFLIH